MKHGKDGSITVFLSLILLLILAVITTTVEAARVTIANVYSERALTTSMDSILAEYYQPLLKEYHIFGLDSSYGNDAIQTDTIISKMKEYMDYTFEPNKDLYLIDDYIPITNANLFGIQTKNLEVSKTTSIMDYNGELFAGQAISYMKYKKVGDGINSFLDKASVIKNTEIAQTVLDKKQKTEQSLYDIDKEILRLMSLIDGISINDTGIQLNSQGNLIIKDNFIKKICVTSCTKDNLVIHNDMVFGSLQGHYVQVTNLFDTAISNVNDLIDNKSLLESAESTYQSLFQTDQSHMKAKDKKALNKQIKEAQTEVDYYASIEDNLLKTLESSLDSINKLVNGTLACTYSALPTVQQLIIKQGIASQDIASYKTLLLESKEKIGEDLYKGLSEDLTSMNKYTAADTPSEDAMGNYDFKGMEETILHNQGILSSIPQFSSESSDTASLSTLKSSLMGARSKMEQYSHSKLNFDYSTLSKPVESEGVLSGMSSLLENGIMDLVIEDKESISKKEMKEQNLPSYIHNAEENAEPNDISKSLISLDVARKLNGVSNVMKSCKGDFDLMGAALDGSEKVGQMLLFQEYLMEHFSCFNQLDNQETQNALNYELEYILMGKSSDYDNLKSIIMRILLIRTMMNVITLISDTKSSNEARALAVGMIGFTGLPALVSITKMIILTVWAFEESLIDIAGLLQGKSIPLLKKGSDIQLALTDLIHINKVLIKSKVAKLPNNQSMLELMYQDYIKLFLFIEGKEKKSYRAMDLIQENLQRKYEDTFYMSNCVFGFRVDAEFQMKTKFIAIPFVKNILEYKGNYYSFHSTKEYSY